MKNNNDFVYIVRDIYNFRDLIHGSAEEYGDLPAFVLANGDENYEVTFNQFFAEIKALATYLNAEGLEKKHVAVIGKNSYSWALSYFAITTGVGVVVPLDKELKPVEISNLIEMGDVEALIYSSDVADKVGELENAGLKKYCMDIIPDYLRTGNDLIKKGDTSYDNHMIHPNELGILLFTSGTTGIAKGVMLSQYNVCNNIMNVLRRVKVTPNDRVMSILPLHHTYESMSGMCSILYAGASISYNGSLRTLLADFKRYQPTIFITVPLILENFYYNILKKYGQIKGGMALLSLQKGISNTLPGKDRVISKKIFGQIQSLFGGKLTRFLCGAAPLSPEIFKAFESFGFDVYIGYGLTETSPVCIMHDDRYRNPYDIGYPLSGVKAKIINPNDEGVGELAIKGANVMLGYYKNPEATAKVFTEDGYFLTGDLVKRRENGAYKIMGRCKTMIVTKNGKKIFPEELEFYLLKSPYISECVVFGKTDEEGDTYVAVNIFPNFDKVNEYLNKKGIHPDTEAYTTELQSLIADAVKSANRNLPNFKMIKKTTIRYKEFEKTTTRKIKLGEKSNYDNSDEVSE